MHSPAEIEANLPALTSFMEPGTVIACHDTSAENEACIRRIIDVGTSCRVGSLFVAEVT